MITSRRAFLAGMGGTLALAVVGGCGGATKLRIEHADATGELAANMYITVLASGRIALAVNKAEIGQGVTTGFATLAAEELDVAIDQIDIHLADSFPEYRTSFGIHQTGGSTSMIEAFDAIRRAAATVREMLVGAAADVWHVPVRECTVANGRVRHAETRRELGYGELARLAARRSIPEHPRLKPRSEFTAIGKTDLRVDGRAKVDGSTIFGIDVALPGLVHAFAIHGPQLGAQARAFRADAARKRPGVIDVFAFSGGVAVIADKYWQALAAAKLVEIEWTRGDTHGLDTEELRVAMRADHSDGATAREEGHAASALAEAKVKVDAIYEAPYLAHAPLEPLNCTVHVTGTHAEVWVSTQSPSVVQAFVADAIGGSKDDVLVHTLPSGGGFGRRGVADYTRQAAEIAKRVGRPVKLIWSRESDMTQGFYRPQFATAMHGGLSADGKLVAMTSHGVSQSIILSNGGFVEAILPGIPRSLRQVVIDSMLAIVGTNSIPDMFATEGISDTPYTIPNLRVGYTPVRTQLPVSAWRSVGHSFNAFAIESFIDELAHAAGADPFAFRRGLVKPGSIQARVLDGLADAWSAPLAPGRGRGIARHHAFDSEVGEVAEVEIVDNRIKVRKVTCVVDCGIAINPSIVRAQMEGAIIFGLSAALDQQITLKDGVVQQSNYDTFPVLRMFEAPEITVHILDSDKHPTGVGEPGLPPIAGAVANAVFALTRVRLRRMPLQHAWNERGGAA